MFPNADSVEITHCVKDLPITFPAVLLDNTFIRLHFNITALVMSSHYPLIIGVPFLRYWNISSHHCNGSLIFTANSGHHATIPLHHTRYTEPCRTPHCPMAKLTAPTTEIPHEPPFSAPQATDTNTDTTQETNAIATNSYQRNPNDKRITDSNHNACRIYETYKNIRSTNIHMYVQTNG